MRKIVALLMMVLLGFTCHRANAQDAFESQTLGDLPPQMTIPSPVESLPRATYGVDLPPLPSATTRPLEPLTLPSNLGDDQEQLAYGPILHERELFPCDPALLESTSSWLRRGFWFAEVDAVLFNRSFDRDNVVLMEEFVPQGNGFVRRSRLTINGSKPGVEGAPRLKVGRFLFRDQANRDHTAEFVAFGGGNWSQEGSLIADANGIVDSPFGGPLGFSDALASQYSYDSWFNSFELNYHVRDRMLRDRMELEPSGHWVRRAQPSVTRSFLAGLRYFNLNEQLLWTAFGLPDGPDAGTAEETGSYDIQIQNHLIGTQLGLSQSFETARWSIEGRVKGGVYLNMIDAESDFAITGGVNEGGTDAEADTLAWIGEAALIGRYHIRPNVSLRLGLEVMHLSSVQHAPSLIDFVPTGSPLISAAGDSVYLGCSIGAEGYW